MYEPKRAGGVYENLMRVLRAGNNSGPLPGIWDVQLHKSQSGQHTRVETELQPSGTVADLNISIIMDSDSNLSNALGHASIEYESLDQTGPSDDGPASTANDDSSGGGGRIDDSSGRIDDSSGRIDDVDGRNDVGGGRNVGGGGRNDGGGGRNDVGGGRNDGGGGRNDVGGGRYDGGGGRNDGGVGRNDGGGGRNDVGGGRYDDGGGRNDGGGGRNDVGGGRYDDGGGRNDGGVGRNDGGGGRYDGGGGRTGSGGVSGRGTDGSGGEGGGRGAQAGVPGHGGGFAGGPAGGKFLDSDADAPESSASIATPQSPEGGPRDDESEPDSDEDVDEDEEGGEGEEGDFDDAMRHYKRYVDGENVDALRGPANDDDAKETRRKLPVGHLEKEGVVIGCMSVFSDIHVKEYIVLLSDEMIQAFLVDPGRFRAVANKTKCEIEVTRRILNRRMGRYRWLKYLIVDIRGPSYSAIDQCDKMMISLFPPFRDRKPYGRPAVVSIFLKETTPDNTDLYFNYQRTGPSQRMFGEIPLRAPFRRTKIRPIESTPWKANIRRQQWGIIEPKNDRMETVMSHVYPERGGIFSGALDHSIKWAEAADQAVVMSKAKDVAWAQALKARKLNSEPLYANVYGE